GYPLSALRASVQDALNAFVAVHFRPCDPDFRTHREKRGMCATPPLQPRQGVYAAGFDSVQRETAEFPTTGNSALPVVRLTLASLVDVV
ncbi:MAG: hypothetical protein ACRESQ_06860, partial [Gammaproteobacteria bacterium]